MTTELIKKQLVGKNAVYARRRRCKAKPRTFALLSYDTPDGQYKASWDDFYKELKAAGAPVVGARQLLPQPRVARRPTRRTIATKLKATGATTIIFTGDPIFPEYLTTEMTQQNYFPEWVMAGTVLADTNVFARTFDQQQWTHAFGLQLIPRAAAQDAAGRVHAARVVVRHAAARPSNNYAIIEGDVRAADDRPPARRPEPHARDVPRRHLCHASAADAGPSGIGTIVTLRQPRLLAGHRLRRPRQRRHPLLGPERRRAPTRPAPSARACTGSSTAGGATCPGHWPTDAGQAVRPGRTRSRSTRRTTSRPTWCRRPYPVPADAPAGEEVAREAITAFAGDGYPTVPRDVAAHDARGHARDHRVVGHVDAGDDRARRDHDVAADARAGQHDRAVAEPAAARRSTPARSSTSACRSAGRGPRSRGSGR